MNDRKVISFDITKKYKTDKELTAEEYYDVGEVIVTLFKDIYIDKYDNIIKNQNLLKKD